MEVTVFKTPSGNIRGYAIEMMELKKGKKTAEKRILHAHIFQSDPLDFITVELPTRMSPDELRAAAAKMIDFANEVEHQYDLRDAPITYQGILDAYTVLLRANPGKALRICETSDNAMAFLVDGSVVNGYLQFDGSLSVKDANDFDESAWITKDGRWDSDESHAVTMKFVNEPQFVDYKRSLI
jgi:hypothetical protein